MSDKQLEDQTTHRVHEAHDPKPVANAYQAALKKSHNPASVIQVVT
jgi:hypothetical protein